MHLIPANSSFRIFILTITNQIISGLIIKQFIFGEL